jgi:hypothetical protein
MEPNVHHFVHNSPLFVLISSQTKTVHALSFYSYKIHLNNIHPITYSPVYLNRNVSSNDHVKGATRTGTSAFLLLLSCRARWLMPPDVPQPVRLIVLTLLYAFQLSPPVVPRVHIPRAILVVKAGTMRARNGRLILPRRRLPRNV